MWCFNCNGLGKMCVKQLERFPPIPIYVICNHCRGKGVEPGYTKETIKLDQPVLVERVSQVRKELEKTEWFSRDEVSGLLDKLEGNVTKSKPPTPAAGSEG